MWWHLCRCLCLVHVQVGVYNLNLPCQSNFDLKREVYGQGHEPFCEYCETWFRLDSQKFHYCFGSKEQWGFLILCTAPLSGQH